MEYTKENFEALLKICKARHKHLGRKTFNTTADINEFGKLDKLLKEIK